MGRKMTLKERKRKTMSKVMRRKVNFKDMREKRCSGNSYYLLFSVPILFFFLSRLSLLAQTTSVPESGYRLSQPPAIYLETENIASEIISAEELARAMPFIKIVSSEAEAQVRVFIKRESREDKQIFLLHLQGLKELAGESDELKFELPLSASSPEIQKELLSVLRGSLMRFVGQSAISRRLQIKFLETVKPTAVADPWNFWTFNLNLSSFLNGEKSYNARNLFGSFSASRITPEWKIRLSLGGSWAESKYQYDSRVIRSTYEAENFRALIVRSINEHWSVGAYFTTMSSTYENVKLSLAPAPAIEFNLFPYSESTRRQLRFLYRLSFNAVSYREETIYLRTRENLWRQSLTAALELKRRWGTVSLSVQGSNYFHDWRQNRLTLSGEISLRLFKGLSFSLNGDYSRIHDQISLPRRGASLEEVILRRRQIETAYNYYFYISLNYTFGSILSKIVNPRFGEGGGFSIFISM